MTIFENIIMGTMSCHKIFEDEFFLAFLDINPVQIGHTLIIPKIAVDDFWDIEPLHIAKMIQFAQKISHSLSKTIKCKKVGMSVIGLEVPHAHIHLIPINVLKDMDFNKKLILNDEELSDIAQRIIQNLQQ